MIYRDVDGFLSDLPKKTGVCKIKSLQLVFYWNSSILGLTETGGKVLACFSGAITNRSHKTPPFISGIGVSKELGYPLIAFSDPTIELSDNLNLAWYAGNEYCLDLSAQIAILLDSLSKKLCVEFLLFGGSGGGFASLAISSLMKSNVVVLVWNPQVQIERYSKKFVSKYIECAFPSYVSDETSSPAEVLEKIGVFHKINSNDFNNNRKKVIYLQNMSDAHVFNQCKFFFKDLAELKRVSNNFFSQVNGIFLYIGDWGVGHLPPPKSLIIAFLKILCTSSPSEAELLSVISNSEIVDNKTNIPIHAVSPPSQFDFIITKKESNQYEFELIFVDQVEFGYEFAFYLLVNGVRVFTQWYSKSSTFKPPIERFENIEVVVFFKDIFGEILHYKVSVESISCIC